MVKYNNKDELHRLDYLPYEYYNGDKIWYKNGQYHRIDGPAIEWSNGYKEWYYQGQYINCNSQQEFERIIKLKALW